MFVHKSPGSSSSSELNKIVLPSCIPYGHSSTKWLLNTFRNSANKRLMAMVKERPNLFRHTFQIFDKPSEIMADPTDTKPLFNNMAVLYLKPLSLAVYMRCKSAVEILLESTLCNPMECSYASDVHVQLQENSGDLLELLPACIAVRRQFLEVLPILFRTSPLSRCAPCSPRTSFALNYVSKRIQRSTVYDDIFHYVTEIAQFNRHINVVRILEILISRCPGFYAPGRLDESRKTELHSLFRRLLHVALFVDMDNRICFPLIQCMDLLIRYSHFQPGVQFGTSESLPSLIMTFTKLQEVWLNLTEWIRDCYICVALLFQLYAVLLIKSKSNAIGHAGNLLFRVLIETNSFDIVNTVAVDELANTLDFILKQDIVGQKIQQDRKIFNLQRGRIAGECGDCRYLFFSFLQSQDTLISVLDKLKARFKLAQLRRMHIICLARSNRLGYNGNHVPRHPIVAHHDPIDSERKVAYALRHRYVSDFCRYGKFEKQPSASFVIGSDPHEVAITTGNERHNALNYVSVLEPSEVNKNDCHVNLSVPVLCGHHDASLACRNEPVIPSIVVGNPSQHTSVKMADQDGGFSTNENKESVPPARTFQPTVYANDKCHSVMQSCSVTDDLDPTSSKAAPRLNNFAKPYGETIELVDPDTPFFFDGTKRGDEKLGAFPTVGGTCAADQTVNVSVFPKLRYENLSLRDVDQLIDYITMSALANERALGGQLIEEFFRNYIDRCPTDLTGTSSAESFLGTQTCSDDHITTGSVPLGPWSPPIYKGCVSPQRSADCITSLKPCGRPHVIGSKDVLHNESTPSLKKLECLCTCSIDTNPHALQDFEVDDPNSPSYHKFLWSCAKPICHVHRALETIKQKAITRRVISHSDANVDIADELPKSCT